MKTHLFHGLLSPGSGICWLMINNRRPVWEQSFGSAIEYNYSRVSLSLENEWRYNGLSFYGTRIVPDEVSLSMTQVKNPFGRISVEQNACNLWAAFK